MVGLAFLSYLGSRGSGRFLEVLLGQPAAWQWGEGRKEPGSPCICCWGVFTGQEPASPCYSRDAPHGSPHASSLWSPSIIPRHTYSCQSPDHHGRGARGGMGGRPDQVVTPELHGWDLPHRSVPGAGFRPIPEEQTLDINAHKPAPAVHPGQSLVPGMAHIRSWVSPVPCPQKSHLSSSTQPATIE